MKKFITAALLLAGLATAASSCEEKKDPEPSTTMQISGSMNSANCVPAVTVASAGTGAVSGTYDTKSKLLTYSVTYAGLTGTPGSGHFHLGSPTTPSSGANITVSFTNVATSPITGSTTLTASQADELLKGNFYVNIHTSSNKAGEIRAQVAVK